MAPHGGRREPDGRAPVAPGVGAQARRHDLEAPATPGLSDSDLQQGDVQRLERSQKIAPIARPTSGRGGGQRNIPVRTNASGGTPQAGVPDPIAMAAQRNGGNVASDDFSNVSEPLDVDKWMPLLREIARNPKVSGPLTTTLMAQFTNVAGLANTSSVHIIDQNAADRALEESL